MPYSKQPVLLETNLPGVKLFSRGKVRDVYELGDKLLVVATDRLSAFDVVMREGIPDKGRVLNQLSRFWFDLIKDEIPHHFITAKITDYPPELQPFSDQLEGRSMLVQKARPFPIECVVRGYLVGSGWKEYRANGSVCGIKLPAGLLEASRLENPIFTPSTKAQTGHDENITWEDTVARIGEDAARKLREMSLELYGRGREFAEGRGIIIADTKFEWGLKGDQVILIDEVLTPDSSRFWPLHDYAPGKPQPSFDKQFVRDYLESLRWNKQPPPPPLPAEVVQKTSEKYREAYRLMTGDSLR
ncbi:MAG: phosphoribosylaminoimidazolesuccinocarboxamide synthase [Terriglobia bacterium]